MLVIILVIVNVYLLLISIIKLKNRRIVNVIHLIISSFFLIPCIAFFLAIIWPENIGFLGELAKLSGLVYGVIIGLAVAIVLLVREIARIKKENKVSWFTFFLLPVQLTLIMIIWLEHA